MRGSRTLASVVSAVLVLAPGVELRAQPSESAVEDAPPLSPLARFSVEHLADRLDKGANERRRAMQRLAGLGTDVALERLTSFALEHRAELGAKDWLCLVRALSPHARRSDVELVLAAVMSLGPVTSGNLEELALLDLARAAAALSLAASSSDSALSILSRALRTSRESAALAADALLAHPPQRLAPLLEAPGEPTVELARVLGQLGDQRAFHVLRDWVRGAGADVRAASALALTELGHMETVPLARQWLSHSLPVLRDAALEILMAAHDPLAARALLERLQSGELDAEGRELLLAFPHPDLAAAAGNAGDAAAADATWRWTLIGRSGGAGAVRQLEAALSDPSSAVAAAQALSRMPEREAALALERAVNAGVALPLTLRALAARAWSRGESFPASLEARLTALARSKSASERSAVAWARSLRGSDAALAELEADDEARVIGAASNALALDADVLERAAARFESAAPGRIRTALVAALSSSTARAKVTSSSLRALIAEGGAVRPVALRALASRASREVGALVQRFIADPDPMLRAHVARGLGESGEASAVGTLTRMLEFETDESVRQALVVALGAYTARKAAQRTLAVAARLDASPRVRSAARLALGGVMVGDPAPHAEPGWAVLRANSGVRDPAELSAALVLVGPGLAFPVLDDGSGLVVVAGAGIEARAIRLL